MNKERLQVIIDRAEADPQSRNTTRSRLAMGIATLAQIDSGCKQDIYNARRDARIWLDLSNKQADYWLCSLRTLAEIKEFIEKCNYDNDGYDREGYDRAGYNCLGYGREGYDRDGYDRDGYDRWGYGRDGYDRTGYDWDGYDFDGLDKHNKPKPKLTA